MKANRLTVSAILLSALFSCRSPQTLMILTDAPEMVAYAEIFNRQSSSCKAYVTYSPTPETELRLNTEMYDLVFASSILDKEFIDLFANLNSLVRNNRISGSQLYPHLLETYRNQGTRPVIPAAFDLHIFLTPKPNPVPDDRMISFKDLMDACKEFSVFRDGVYSKIAYSPTWSRSPRGRSPPRMTSVEASSCRTSAPSVSMQRSAERVSLQNSILRSCDTPSQSRAAARARCA